MYFHTVSVLYSSPSFISLSSLITPEYTLLSLTLFWFSKAKSIDCIDEDGETLAFLGVLFVEGLYSQKDNPANKKTTYHEISYDNDNCAELV